MSQIHAIGIAPEFHGSDWKIERERFRNLSPEQAHQLAKERNAAAQKERDRKDKEHAARTRSAPAPQPAQPRGESLNERTTAARRQMCEAAIVGSADALEVLRTQSAWFPASTANSGRDHRKPPASDAEVKDAARQYLASTGGHQQQPARTTTPAPGPTRKRATAREVYEDANNVAADKFGWRKAFDSNRGLTR